MQPETGTLKDLPCALAANEALVLVVKAEDVLSALPAERLALPAEESERIARYKNDVDRRARRAAHGLVRYCLGTLLSLPPQDLHFTRDGKGRPFLANQNEIDFNLSHSGRWIVVGLSRVGQIGVDVQEGSEAFDWQAVSRAYLHKEEIDAIQRLPKRAQGLAALELWCLKESFLKATGEGLATPPYRLCPRHDGDNWLLSHRGYDMRAMSYFMPDGSCAAWACALAASPRIISF